MKIPSEEFIKRVTAMGIKDGSSEYYEQLAGEPDYCADCNEYVDSNGLCDCDKYFQCPYCDTWTKDTDCCKEYQGLVEP